MLDNQGVTQAAAGSSIGLIIKDKLNIKRGALGCLGQEPARVGKYLEGKIFFIEKPQNNSFLLESGTSQTKAFLKEPKVIKAGEKLSYKAELEHEIAFDTNSKNLLNKIVLKQKGKIIAVGDIR